MVIIEKGTNTETVTAVADEGWMFLEWDDGYKKPTRSDKRIGEDRIYIALFQPLSTDGDPSDEGDPSDQQSDQSKPSDTPQDQQQQPNKPDDSEGEQPEDMEDQQDSTSQMGGGKYEHANQIINGEIYYKEVLEEYKQLLRERLENEGDKLSEEERSIIEAYLGIV